MRIWEITTEFPHRTVLTIGLILLTSGVVLIIIGCVDVTWTAVKYLSYYDNCPVTWPATLENPCNHGNLVWTWISSAIWGGFLILLVGVLAVILTGTRTHRLRYARDMFAVGCILLAFPVCPGVIVCTVLEIVYNEGIFYKGGNSADIEIADDAKFVIPILVLTITVFVWVAAIAALVIVCFRKINVTKKLVLNKPATPPIVVVPQAKPALIVQEPANQIVVRREPTQIVTPVTQVVAQPTQMIAPVMVQQPPPQYEVTAIESPAPPPYFVTAPHPDSAVVHTMNRLNQRGPSIGPMFGPYPPEMFGLEPVPGPYPIGPPGFGPPGFGPPGFGPPGFGPPGFGPPFRGPPMIGPPDVYPYM